MNYKEIQDKYINAGVKNYKFSDAAQVKAVLGYDFRTMRGFKNLSDKSKILAEKLICKYLNGWGLETRESIRPMSIKREKGRFVVKFKNKSFCYLYYDGTVG